MGLLTRRGSALAALTWLLFLAGGGSAHAAIFTVDRTGDGSDADIADSTNACDVSLGRAGDQCTLRAAIQEANATAGADEIRFNVPGDGVKTIQPGTALPDITEQVTIDGYSQPGTSANTKPVGGTLDTVLRIELSGVNLSEFASGLAVGPAATGTSIRGLVINRFGAGILLNASSSVLGNFIGTDATGTLDRGNSFDAVFVNVPSTIGSAARSDRNLLSGNGRAGITTNGRVVVAGNYIGTARDPSSPLPNDGDGMDFAGTGNVVGGVGDSANVIAFNGKAGVVLENVGPGSQVTRNSIHSNGGLGIDLQGDGVTPNDPGDTDTGVNGLQNFPIIESAASDETQTQIAARVRSTPGRQFIFEFFSNPPGGDEGKRFIGAVAKTSNGDGKARVLFAPQRRVDVGDTITATATANISATDRPTSEFSAPRTVVAAP